MLKGQNESSTRANPVHFVETWSSEKSANAEHVSASYTKHVGNAWTHRHVYIYITLHNYRIKAQQKTAGFDLLACNLAHFSWNHAGASAAPVGGGWKDTTRHWWHWQGQLIFCHSGFQVTSWRCGWDSELTEPWQLPRNLYIIRVTMETHHNSSPQVGQHHFMFCGQGTPRDRQLDLKLGRMEFMLDISISRWGIDGVISKLTTGWPLLAKSKALWQYVVGLHHHVWILSMEFDW